MICEIDEQLIRHRKRANAATEFPMTGTFFSSRDRAISRRNPVADIVYRSIVRLFVSLSNGHKQPIYERRSIQKQERIASRRRERWRSYENRQISGFNAALPAWEPRRGLSAEVWQLDSELVQKPATHLERFFRRVSVSRSSSLSTSCLPSFSRLPP